MDNNGSYQEDVPSQSDQENQSLRQLLRLYERSIAEEHTLNRDLEQKVAAAAELQSWYDLQTEELNRTRNYTRDLLNQAEAAAEREKELEKQLSLSVSTNHQLEAIRIQYQHLQVQLNDLAERLLQLNLLQQQQLQYAGRVAELESLLANAEEEIELLRQHTENPEA